MTKRLTTAQRRNFRKRNKLKQVNRAGKPRLSIHRSGKQIYAQIIDDLKGTTVAAASTLEPELKEQNKSNGATRNAAETVGKLVAERAKKAGVESVQFDRGRFLYHGRVQALADAARAGGLKF
jgi:large subunit ribosomal protein L18